MLPRRKGMKFILAVTGCWFLFIVFVTLNERVKTTSQQQFMQQVASSDGEAILPLPQARQKSRDSAEADSDHAFKSVVEQQIELEEQSQSKQELERMKAIRNELEAAHDDLAGKEYGELGQPVSLPKDLSPLVKKKVDKGWLDNAFNQYISDLISVNRSLPDVRDPG